MSVRKALLVLTVLLGKADCGEVYYIFAYRDFRFVESSKPAKEQKTPATEKKGDYFFDFSLYVMERTVNFEAESQKNPADKEKKSQLKHKGDFFQMVTKVDVEYQISKTTFKKIDCATLESFALERKMKKQEEKEEAKVPQKLDPFAKTQKKKDSPKESEEKTAAVKVKLTDDLMKECKDGPWPPLPKIELNPGDKFACEVYDKNSSNWNIPFNFQGTSFPLPESVFFICKEKDAFKGKTALAATYAKTQSKILLKEQKPLPISTESFEASRQIGIQFRESKKKSEDERANFFMQIAIKKLIISVYWGEDLPIKTFSKFDNQNAIQTNSKIKENLISLKFFDSGDEYIFKTDLQIAKSRLIIYVTLNDFPIFYHQERNEVQFKKENPETPPWTVVKPLEIKCNVTERNASYILTKTQPEILVIKFNFVCPEVFVNRRIIL